MRDFAEEKKESIPTPGEVKSLFRDTFALFKANHEMFKKYNEYRLFHEIINNFSDLDLKTVTAITTDTYLFYTKWIAVNEPNWDDVISELHKIEQKHPFELCRKILIELVNVIESAHMERSDKDG